MGHFKEAADSVMEALKAWDGLRACHTVFAYEPALKPTELETPWLALSLRGVEGKLLTVGGVEKQVVYEIGLAIYAPASQAGVATAVLDEAAQCLFFSDRLAVIRCKAGNMQWDEKAGALRLPCSFWLEEVI